MKAGFSSRAIVLYRAEFGEADLYVHFFTKDWGQISCLARSARKSRKRYVGGLDLFCHDEINLRGDPKERPYLTDLVVLNSFSGIRNDLQKLMLAGKVVQWVRKLANITTPMPRVYSLLGQTLSLIEKEPLSRKLEPLGLLFKCRLLAQLGIQPSIKDCARCGEEIKDCHIFDIASGGQICLTCFKKAPPLEYHHLDESAEDFLVSANKINLTKWGELDYPESQSRKLSQVLTQFAMYHSQVRLPV